MSFILNNIENTSQNDVVVHPDVPASNNYHTLSRLKNDQLVYLILS